MRTWAARAVTPVLALGLAGALAGCAEEPRSGGARARAVDATVYVAVSSGREGSLLMLDARGGRRDEIDLVVPPRALEVAPAGAPNEGTVFLQPVRGSRVGVLAPGARAETMIQVGDDPFVMAVAPAGTPNAGTLYVLCQEQGYLWVIEPGAEKATRIAVGPYPNHLVVAPAGVPGAGSVYIADYLDGSVSVLEPGGTGVRTVVTDIANLGMAVAPASAPLAGALYVLRERNLDENRLVEVLPGRTGEVQRKVPPSTRMLGVATNGTVRLWQREANAVVEVSNTGQAQKSPIDDGLADSFLAAAGEGDDEFVVVTANSGSSSVVSVAGGGASRVLVPRLDAQLESITFGPRGTTAAGIAYLTDVLAGDLWRVSLVDGRAVRIGTGAEFALDVVVTADLDALTAG